jgi:hypothetical protein
MKNKTKFKAYKYSFEKLNEALEFEFYFEAILIEYAIVEDRIYSLLKKIGFSKENNSISKNNQRFFKLLLNNLNARWIDLNKRLDFIELLLEENENIIKLFNSLQFSLFKELSFKLSKIKIDIPIVFAQLREWTKARNDFVHNFVDFFQNPDDSFNFSKKISTDGIRLIRLLDKIIRKL